MCLSMRNNEKSMEDNKKTRARTHAQSKISAIKTQWRDATTKTIDRTRKSSMQYGTCDEQTSSAQNKPNQITTSENIKTKTIIHCSGFSLSTTITIYLCSIIVSDAFRSYS